MKTITQSEIQKLLNEGFSVRSQSNGLVFVGMKIKTSATVIEGISYGVLREEVYRLVSERDSHQSSNV